MRRVHILSLLVLMVVTVMPVPALAVYETPTRVSGPPVATASVGDHAYSPDSAWAVFQADLDVNGVHHLWSVPLDGTADPTPVRIVDLVDSSQQIEYFAISPDSTRVVFLADLDTNNVLELYSVPIDGSGPPVKLNGSNPLDSSTEWFAITSDSARVVFMGDLLEADTTQLFSRAIDGSGTRTTLSPTPDATGGDVEDFQLTPDGQLVAFVGQLREHGPGNSYGDVLVSPVDGSSAAQYVTSTPSPGNEGVYTFAVTPDSARVVYATQHAAGRTDLRSRPLDLSEAEIVLSLSPSGEDVTDDLVLSPTGDRVVYRGDLDVSGDDDLYSALVDTPGSQVRISDAADADGDVINFVASPDGTRVAYRAGPLHLWTTSITGDAAPVMVSAPIGLGEFGVINFKIAPDSSHVLWLQDVDDAHAYELFARPLDGSGVSIQVNTEPPASDGFVTRFEFAPDASRVVYMGELDVADRHDLYSRPLDGTGTQVKLNPDEVDGLATPILVAPDSATVLFPDDVGTGHELHVSGRGQFAPGPASGIAGTDVDHESATVTWDPPFGNPQVTSYEVEVTPAPTSGPATFTVDGATLELLVGNLAPETTYTVTITATNDAGDSASADGMFTTSATPPPDPDPDPDPDPTPGDPGVHRLAGTNRYDTAAQVALDRFDPADVDVVYLAVGGNFPDALAGGPLAAAQGAPILLATSTSLPEPTASALTALDPATVVALGGEGVLPDAILDAAATAAGGAATDRIAGTNRYETAAAIAAELPPSDRAFLAVGTNFPDALAGGPATAGAPILLAAPTSLPAATADALGKADPDTVIALGGESAVPPSVLTAAAQAAGSAAEGRVAGTNRYTTATAIADLAATPPASIYVAVGGNFPDALAGSPAAAAEGAPIILIASSGVPDDVATWIDALPALTRIVILGGEGVVSPAVATELATYLD